jgi:septum site-determining protein MinD
MLSVDDILHSLEIDLIGIVPSDKSITISINKGEPIGLDHTTKIGGTFRQIALRIVGEAIPFDTLPENDTGLAGTIKRWFAPK